MSKPSPQHPDLAASPTLSEREAFDAWQAAEGAFKGNAATPAALVGPSYSSAALAASIFHFQQYSIPQVKEFLRERGVVVRQ